MKFMAVVKIKIEFVYIRNGGFEVLKEQFNMRRRYLKEKNIRERPHLQRSLRELVCDRFFSERVYVKDIPEVAGRYVELQANMKVPRRFIFQKTTQRRRVLTALQVDCNLRRRSKKVILQIQPHTQINKNKPSVEKTVTEYILN